MANANVAYSEKLAEVKQLMAKLNNHLELHALKQSTDQKNWGLVGDLEYYAELLKRIVEPEK